jgi:ATP-binding cassette subfamily B protein
MDKKYNLFSALTLCSQYAPAATAVNITLNILGGVLSPVMVYVIALFIDSALTMSSGEPQVMPLMVSAIGMLLGYVYTQFSPVLQRLSIKNLEMQLRNKLRPLLVKKQASLDFELTENPETLDLIAFVSGNMEARIIGILNDFTTTLQLYIQIAGILAILVSYVWWLLPVFVFGAIPLVVISYRGGTALVEKDKEITIITRMMYYLSDVLSGRETAAERILFGFSEGVNKKFKALHRKRSDLNTELIARWESRAKMGGIALNLFVLVAMIALLGDISTGVMTSGGYIAAVGAIITLSRTLANSLSQLLFSISEHIGYMKAYTQFWALGEHEDVLTYSPVPIIFNRLEIKNLRFKYKSTDDYVLKGVNLTIEKGKSYSLIGQNGAGKTTLTKILTGLYRDFEGEISINGRNIREYNINELRSLFSVIYQDYAKYYVSLKDNITFGRNNDGFDKLMETTDLNGVIEKLPMGADTPLGKIFDDGADLSGGEWQKIAIARAVYRDCPFIILDEPTASLSPMMESKIYHKFAEISVDHTQLLISHRLGSTKLSDVLLVLHDGQIVETGSHHDLMAAGGLYAEMFESQSSWYNENESEDIHR